MLTRTLRLRSLVLKGTWYGPWRRPWWILELGSADRALNRWRWHVAAGLCFDRHVRGARCAWAGWDDFDLGPLYVRSLAAVRRRLAATR